MPVVLRKRKAPQPPPEPAPPAKKKASRAGGAKVKEVGTKKTGAKAKPEAKETKAEGKGTKAQSKRAGRAKAEEKAVVEAEDDVKEGASETKESDEADNEAKDKSEESEAKPEEAKSEEKEVETKEAKSDGGKTKVAVGDVIELEGFGGEIETNDGSKTSLSKLVDESKAGVVLFTYPKASTPGCTNQACLFRDAYDALTADGLAIYGLSTDSPKANTSFKDKQRLPYPLLCDAQASLIAAIGLKKQPRGTQRGVFVVNKAGKVLLAEPGGPAATVERVRELVNKMGA